MTIDWTKPLELSDGTYATLFEVYGDGGVIAVSLPHTSTTRDFYTSTGKPTVRYDEDMGWAVAGRTLRNVSEPAAQPVNPTTLYREIDALGGYVDVTDKRAVGRAEQLEVVLEILAKRGFTEQADAVPPMHDDAMALIHEMARVSHTSTDIDHYDEAKRIHDAVTPIDPDLLEARKLVADGCDPKIEGGYQARILCGDEDGGRMVQNALAAIKRGRELAAR